MNAFTVVGWLAVGLSGCAERYAIPPTQLSVFNDELKTNSGVQKVLRVETANGQMVEMNPPVVVTITTSNGKELKLCSPMRTDFDNGVLSIHHACGNPVSLDRNDIEKVEVEEW